MNKVKSALEKRIQETSNLINEFSENIHSNNSNLSDEKRASMKVYEERLKKIEELKNLASKALSIADKLF
ncbi:MAG: hypothetical protein AMJ78_06390 [Omnitrophica WOR_2 bacterium SM23_29]|nr:MAG: hypothetical protein AMJ78_06390 [Omnitrophica WOR_2 bacterium SM23_29]